MQRWRGLDRTPPGWGRCVVTIGVFDGVHRGHQQIIGRAVERAGDSGLPAVVVTFDPHPSEVVRPGSHPAVLTAPPYKAGLLVQLGADVLCVLPFTLGFSRMSAEDFVHTVLLNELHAAAVVVGENFRFGHKAAGDMALLRQLGSTFGFATDPVPLLREGDITISSTYVRCCVAAGDVEPAARALGRDHRVDGVVVRGDMRGRSLGYPTANLEPAPYAAVPTDGVYAGRLIRGAQRWPAAISVGTNPTFDGRDRRVEAHALDVDLDLYGDHVGVEFAARLRDTVRFDGVEPLVAQMRRDVDRTRALVRP